ncbi:MAG: hypothetical protein AABX17_04010 [Nanoarchaeota archaeon]
MDIFNNLEPRESPSGLHRRLGIMFTVKTLVGFSYEFLLKPIGEAAACLYHSAVNKIVPPVNPNDYGKS